MAALTRVNQKQFAGTSGFHQVSQFGSLANSTPNFTLDPAVIQALSEFDSGWYDAVLGENSPAIQDMNALCFLIFYQLRYMFEKGIPEWNAATTYYIGSIVQDGSGVQFLSLADTNINNIPGTAGAWFPIGTVGNLNSVLDSVTFPSNKRLSSPSPVTLPASAVVNVPANSIVSILESVTITPGAQLVIAPGGIVNII